MDINIKLDPKFSRAFNKLVRKYGDRLAELNGLSERQLNYTEFIDNFIDKDTVADATIDSNANVSHKDIVTLENEMRKPHSKLLAFNKIYYEIDKEFGKKRADEWLEAEWDGHFYLHDAHDSSFKPYCFSGDTKILTNKGIYRLDELVDSNIKVLNKNHGWEDATVSYFGKQHLKKLILERYGIKKEIFVTGNHKWFARRGKKSTYQQLEVFETNELKPGYKIPYNTSKIWSQVTPSPFGVAHGFFTGDGDKGVRLRANFCGDKTALLPYFTPANVTGTEKEYTTIGMPQYFRQLPSLQESPSYLYGWLSGYFAADGCVDERGRCTLSSTVYENLDFVRQVLCILGMPVQHIRYQDRISNYTNEMGRVYIMSLSEEYLKDDFFIRPLHKERIAKLRLHDHPKKDRHWTVVSVEDTNRTEDVYCAVVPGTQSFTLDGNVLTHNCYAVDIERLCNEGLYFIGENFNSQPPKHLNTFTDFVGEFVSWTCNRSSGAVGLPSFLVYSYYFWKEDVKSGYTNAPDVLRDQEFQRIIYKLNQPYLRGGIQSAFTNFSIFDHEYLEALFGGKFFPNGEPIIEYEEEIIEYQKEFMRVCSQIRSENMMTYPVLTISLLYKDGKFCDEPFARWACEHNMKWADSNFFISEDVTSLSSCCRLKNDIKNLGYFSSIGGTALEVGSVKVNTLNLARIAYESDSEEEYMEHLEKYTLLNFDVLDRIRHIIKRNAEKGLLPNISMGIMNLKNCYNTLGILGMYECLEHFGYITIDQFGNTSYTDKAMAFAKRILKRLNDLKDEYIKDKDYMISIEAIPGEKAASTLMLKDMIFHSDEKYTLPLYGNQWIPLGIKTSLQEKTRISAELSDACQGGDINHTNIEAPFNNFETAWQMLNYMAESGVPYFAFCTRISACKNNHGFYGETCPICGGKKETTYQRIVGFLTPEKSYSKERKAEFKLRNWMDLNNIGE